MSKKVVILKNRMGKKGGLEKHALRIADGFLARGCKVLFLTTEKLDSLSHVQLKIPRWPRFWEMEAFDRAAHNWINSHKADIILGLDRNRHQTHIRAGNGVHAAYLQKRLQLEGSFRCKFDPLHKRILALEKAGFENPSLQMLITNSQMVKEEILHYYRVDPKKIQVIHNGVEWQEMEGAFTSWQEGKAQHAEKYGLDPQLFHFLFAGSGFLRKGLDILLQALSLLKNRNFFLSIVGKDKKINRYMALAKKLQIQDRVRFFGPVDNIIPFYQMADCLVIPSWYDPFANVTVEALAMGLYVISSKNNGGSEILTKEKGNILSDLRNVEEIAAILEKAMHRPKTLASSLLIRNSIKHLDFSIQMTKLLDLCLL